MRKLVMVVLFINLEIFDCLNDVNDKPIKFQGCRQGVTIVDE
jgi:hypothetical protein